MRLYMFRHAPALSREEWSGADSERPLTHHGLDVAQRTAEKIVSLELDLGVVLTSPYERALRTALILRERLPEVPVVEDDRLTPAQFTPDALTRILESRADTPNLMLVGHEPSMTNVLSQLLGGGRYRLRKGGLVRIDLDPADLESAVLKWFLAPRVL